MTRCNRYTAAPGFAGKPGSYKAKNDNAVQQITSVNQISEA
ncbi:hypothetical protein [Pseudomonas sp. SbOxS1]|nr:hypothetical protein [Pseudomonas sp. SbOxS1]